MTLPAVTLRSVKLEDAADLAALHTDPDIQKWLDGHITPDRCRGSIQAWIRMMRDDISWYYSVLDSNAVFVGFCTILRHEERQGSYHLTIGISRSVRGQGYAQSAIIEAVKLVKQLPKVKSLVALVEDGNISSQKLMLKFDPSPTNAMAEKILPDRTVKEWTFKLS